MPDGEFLTYNYHSHLVLTFLHTFTPVIFKLHSTSFGASDTNSIVVDFKPMPPSIRWTDKSLVKFRPGAASNLSVHSANIPIIVNPLSSKSSWKEKNWKKLIFFK